MHVQKMLGAIVASALLFALPVPAAHADTYAPDAVNQDFSGSQGGWTHTTEYSGLVGRLPAAVNSWSAGGADGNGYVRTQFSSLAETLAGTSVGIWESPSFTYDGLKGKTPGSVTFDLNILRRAVRAALSHARWPSADAVLSSSYTFRAVFRALSA